MTEAAPKKKQKRINYQTPVGIASGYNHLTKPDVGGEYSDGKYKGQMTLTEEQAKPLLEKLIEALIEENGPNVIKKPYNCAIKEDEDKPGVFILKAKSKHKPGIWDTGKNPVVHDDRWYIGSGSRMAFSGTIHAGKAQGTPYVGLYLNDIMLVEHQGGGGQAFADFEEEGSFKASAVKRSESNDDDDDDSDNGYAEQRGDADEPSEDSTDF